VREHGATVTAFYASNVEQYLFQQGDAWRRFYTNVSTLPLDESSTFIRSISDINPRRLLMPRICPIADLLKAFYEGRTTTYADIITMSK
jgi:hypothetical protein